MGNAERVQLRPIPWLQRHQGRIAGPQTRPQAGRALLRAAAPYEQSLGRALLSTATLPLAAALWRSELHAVMLQQYASFNPNVRRAVRRLANLLC